MANATDLLQRAKSHLQRVLNAREDPTDWDDLTIYGFYCVEAAVVAAATFAGVAVPPNHPAKAAAAAKLASTYGIPDVSGLLRDLNLARKATAYGDRVLPALDPGDIARRIEEYVDAVDAIIRSK